MKTPQVDPAEVCRYLGYRGAMPDEKTMADITRCIGELAGVADTRTVQKNFPLTIQGETVSFAGRDFVSAKLAGHLAGCTSVELFAATIGLSVDRYLARAQLVSIADAAILDAAATALVEALCDEVNENIRQKACESGMQTRSRFSPGYGDFPLTAQRDILSILSAEKLCGITLTDGGMMMPSKSVTALVGIGKKQEHAAEEKAACGACAKEDCAFRSV